MGALSSVIRGVDAANSIGAMHSSWQMNREQQRRHANGKSRWTASKDAAASNPYNRIGVKTIVAVLASVVLCYSIALVILFAYGVKDGIFMIAFAITIVVSIPILVIVGMRARMQSLGATLGNVL